MHRLSSSLLTLVARRLEDANTWKRDGHRSVAEQLAAVAGVSVSAARNILETSKQVEALPILKPCEALSINNPEELASVEKELRKQLSR